VRLLKVLLLTHSRAISKSLSNISDETLYRSSIRGKAHGFELHFGGLTGSASPVVRLRLLTNAIATLVGNK
jgi:hypothetical protein